MSGRVQPRVAEVVHSDGTSCALGRWRRDVDRFARARQLFCCPMHATHAVCHVTAARRFDKIG
jgi:hypothetical protein